jgi:hypothetical protein
MFMGVSAKDVSYFRDTYLKVDYENILVITLDGINQLFSKTTSSAAASMITLEGLSLYLPDVLSNPDVIFSISGKNSGLNDRNNTEKTGSLPEDKDVPGEYVDGVFMPYDEPVCDFIFGQPGKPKIIYNGALIDLDTAVYAKDGNVMLPLRFISEALGIKDISWDIRKKQAIINYEGHNIVITAGSKTAVVPGEEYSMAMTGDNRIAFVPTGEKNYEMSIAAEIVDSRIFAPMDAYSSLFGKQFVFVILPMDGSIDIAQLLKLAGRY